MGGQSRFGVNNPTAVEREQTTLRLFPRQSEIIGKYLSILLGVDDLYREKRFVCF